MAFSVTHTKIRVMSELHSLKFQKYHKIIQANGALNLGLFELKIKLLTYYYLQIIKIGLFVERNLSVINLLSYSNFHAYEYIDRTETILNAYI